MTEKNKTFIIEEMTTRIAIAKALGELETIKIGNIRIDGKPAVRANLVEVDGGIEEIAELFGGEIETQTGEPSESGYHEVIRTFKVGNVEIFHRNFEKAKEEE